MKLERPTSINLQSEAIANSNARQLRGSFQETARIATRDARAHTMLASLKPGETIHIASMGELSLHDVAEAIVSHYGPFDCLTLATWAASADSIKRIVGLRQAGGVARLEALVDSRMPTDGPEAHAHMALSFDLYKPGSNHAKVMAFTGGPARIAIEKSGLETHDFSGTGVFVISTANLTNNPRCEVLIAGRDVLLAEFHRDWIREVIANAA